MWGVRTQGGAGRKRATRSTLGRFVCQLCRPEEKTPSPGYSTKRTLKTAAPLADQELQIVDRDHAVVVKINIAVPAGQVWTAAPCGNEPLQIADVDPAVVIGVAAHVDLYMHYILYRAAPAIVYGHGKGEDSVVGSGQCGSGKRVVRGRTDGWTETVRTGCLRPSIRQGIPVEIYSGCMQVDLLTFIRGGDVAACIDSRGPVGRRCIVLIGADVDSPADGTSLTGTLGYILR